MKYKVFTLLALLAVLLGLTACSGKATPTPAAIATEQAPTAPPTEEALEPTSTAAVQPTDTVSPTATATPEPTQAPKEYVPTFEEAPCPLDLPAGAVEGDHIVCGYVTVPEEHAKPGGATIRLAVAVISSASDTPQPDPLFMLAGGPGQSALASFVTLLAAPGLEGFWANREIVLVEQRGTLYSTPFLRCDEVFELKLDMLEQNLGDEEEEARKLEAWATCRDRFVEEGINLAAYNSLENAADIVAVADVLGYDQFNLYGGSYGSLLAQHIMRDYPERVRSAILDSVSPLRHEPNLLYKAHATDRALRLLFARCQADAACNETYPDLEQVYFDLVDQLNADPATLQIQNPETGDVHDMLLTGDRLVVLTRDLLYATALLPDLPSTIYDMAAGDFTLPELFQSRLLFNLELADGMYNSVICTELADFTAADMADAEGLYPQVARVIEDLIDEVMLQPCQVWGVEHLGDYVTESVAGDISMLLLSGEFDPTVPPHLAEVAAEELTQAYLYTLPGVGHSVLGSSECAHAMMLAFLDDPAQAPDASCIDEMPGLVFRAPTAALELEPFADEERGFSGLVPVGWQELAPANMVRASSAVDPAYFVLEAQPVTAAGMFANLAAQLGLDPELEPIATAEVGNFTWDFYTFELQGYPADLALAEDGEKAYFVFLISPVDEHEVLYNQLFLPAVEAMASLVSEAGADAGGEAVDTQAKYGENFEVVDCPFALPAGHVEDKTVQCGYLTVPENRSDPNSRDIRLAVVIFRHPSGESEPDPIIYLEGGPGGSPLEIRASNFDAYFGPLFAANRDIILFDQRGVGFSEPALDCPAFTELYLDLLDFEVDGGRLTAQEVLDRKVEAFTACAEDLSAVADLSAYNTAANAADVNDLRLALGYEQVNLHGTSYGTRLALGVMRDFPEGVRSVMLDAPYIPDVDVYLDTPSSFDRALNVLTQECAADDACNAAYPDLRAVLFDTVDRLNEGPASVQVVHPLTGESYTKLLNGDGLLELVFRSLYDTSMRPVLPQAIYDASEGIFTSFLPIASVDLWRQEFRSWGMYFSVLCREEIPFSSPEAFEAELTNYPEFAGFFGGFEVGGLSFAVCPGWGVGQADAVGNEPIRSDIPTLILVGEYDPIVPPDWGRQVAKTLSNSYFFEYRGMGHGVGFGDCPRSMMLAFLDDPATAPDDACIAEMEVPPFVVPVQAAEAS